MPTKTEKDDAATDATDKVKAEAIAAEKEAADKARDKELADMKAQLAEAEAKLAEKTKHEEAAAQALVQSVNTQTAAGADATPIQCLIRRKGGTQVPFGNNIAKQVIYDFQPINDKEQGSPHVCHVENEEHAARFLALPEAYRLFRGGKGVVDSIPVTSGKDGGNDPFKNRYDDILSIDFEQAENDVVTGWAREILGFTLSHSAKIREKADSLDVKIATGDTMTELLRKIGRAMQAEEQAASDQASNG